MTSTRTGTFPLRLPLSLKRAVEKLSQQDGTSMNQFLVVAAAEKLAVMQADLFFEERKARANHEAFRHILNRDGGATPSPGDELPA